MAKTIIDVSEWQGELNWKALRGHIDGTILRLGYGDDIKSQDDKQWERNVTQCEALDIPFGAYLYSYAATDEQARSEAAHAIRLLKGHKLKYPVYIDLEESSLGGQAKRTANIFCAALEKAGYYAGVYTFESFYNQFMPGYDAYTLWIAKFNSNDGKASYKPSIGVKYDAWQYTSNAVFHGYAGRLDASLFYRDFPSEIAAVSTSAGSADKVLKIAAAEIGNTDGTKYGKWYEKNVDKNSANYNFAGSDVPWCAMFVSWAFAKAGAKCAGLPGAYCPTMLQEAATAGRAVSAGNAKPGDVVYFDWDGGETDHVGVCESNNQNGGYLVTIEGNTDSGIVARKTRYYNSVVKAVRPYYESSSGDSSQASDTSKKVTFRLSTDARGNSWLAANKQGTRGKAIRWIAIKGVGKYRVCTTASGWLPYVSKYDVSDLENGCAGDGSEITAIEVYSSKYRYAVRVLNRSWYPDMVGRTDTSGSNDHFAGDLANAIDGFRISKA